MKMYYNNLGTTVLLVITTIGLYALKYNNVVFEIKLFTYLMIFALNLILFMITILSAASLCYLRNPKLNTKQAINTIECIKTITNTKMNFVFYVIVIVISFIAILLYIYMYQKGTDVFYKLNGALDLIACFTTIAFLIQRYISYCIYVDLEKLKNKSNIT